MRGKHRASILGLGLALVLGGLVLTTAGGQRLAYAPNANSSPLPSGPYDSLTVDQKKQYMGTQTQREIGAAAETGSPAAVPAIAALPSDRPWPTGIQASFSSPPIVDPEFFVANVWAGIVDNVKVLVYAGGTGQAGPSGQGAILVWLFPTDAGVLNRYVTPTADGFVHVVSSSGSRVTLQTETGKIYLFDISTAQFVSG
jgi:hypothetical protein